MKKKIGIILLFAFSLCYSITIAQNSEPSEQNETSFEQYFYLNGNMGFTNFWGDISPKFKLFDNSQFGGGLNLGYQFSSIFGSRFNITSGSAKSVSENEAYEGKFTDFSAQLTIDFTNILQKNNDAKFFVYGFGGIGLIFHNAYDVSSVLVFPAGLGLKYTISDNFDICFESSLHYSMSDKLDQLYLENPPISKMDGFKYTSIGVTYKIKAD